MAMSAEHRSKIAALLPYWWRLYMSEQFSSGTINSKQTNKHYDHMSTCKEYSQFIGKNKKQFNNSFII